ncbi:hypothetical protein FJTKL_08686 [Diaporthe vaccinii]|uniref:Uncharacterized protein n=1 Tax=Diaporthe vaccinii TaxID=105482 RepID=A0ABR4ER07_9PEZI
MSDDWFSSKLAPDGAVEDGCHPEEAQAMKYDLRQETTATEAARAITHPIVAADNPREDLARLWGFLMDSLLELPAEHTGPLSELLKAIENLPEPDFTAIDESQTALRKALERSPRVRQPVVRFISIWGLEKDRRGDKWPSAWRAARHTRQEGRD